MLFGRTKSVKPAYDPQKQKPAVRRSICSGERVAGFIDIATGRFTEIVMIPDDRALEEFKRQYGVTGDMETIY